MTDIRKQATIALASILIGSFGLANTAEAVQFDLTSDGGIFDIDVEPFFTYSEAGIGLTTTGVLEDGTSRNVFRSALGSGVTINALPFDSNQVDGFGPDETLLLTFDQKVRLQSITFTAVGFNDDFTLSVDGTQVLAEDIPGGFPFDSFISEFALSPSVTGTVFGLSVLDNNDDYFVKYVEVQAIPEPLTILGTFTALGLGGLFKKKALSQT